jgi:hypothetical protein
MMLYLFSLTDTPPTDDFAVECPDDASAIAEAHRAAGEVDRDLSQPAPRVAVWRDDGTRVA